MMHMKNFFALAFFILFAAAASAQTATKTVYATQAGAIKGYDPVAYFTQNKPVKGKADITFDWQGATWHFATTENRTLFEQNPGKYAPQYGGWCAYGWAQGYPDKIDPDAWRIVEGKLYLNYNRSVQSDWEQKQQEFIVKADKNWANAKKQ